FMQPDPIPGRAIAPQSLNRYSGLAADPINKRDPQGLMTVEVCTGWWIVNCTYDLTTGEQWCTRDGFIEDTCSSSGGTGGSGGDDTDTGQGVPHSSTPEDVVKNWSAMLDSVLAEGKCGEKLSKYVSDMNDLMSSNNELFLYDARQSDVAGR